MHTPRLSFLRIWNMSFGFLGIQFGWGLQMANMSAIYEYLGATPSQIAPLWVAAPLTGLIVQPIIGHLSDRTWGRLGRRRPYFLTGAILSSLALLLMPNCSALWMAAGLLWILDASINISMEPFRAFVADLLPEEQRTQGFAMQSLFIGLGAVVASLMPWLLGNILHVSGVSSDAHRIPATVRYSFYLGAIAFVTAVHWTILSTKEYPPENMEEFERMKKEGAGNPFHAAGEIFAALIEMPKTMRQLAVVQLCTWLGLFCMWLYFTPAVAYNVFGAVDEKSEVYSNGVAWAGLCYAVQNGVTFFFSFFLLAAARTMTKKNIHTLCLLCGGLGLMSIFLIRNKWALFLSMAGVGVAWASILSMPYAILAGALPPGKTGVYMGIFNFFIVLPEIAASLGFGPVMHNLLHDNRLAAVVGGGGFLLLAAVVTQLVHETPAATEKLQEVVRDEGLLPTATPPGTPV